MSIQTFDMTDERDKEPLPTKEQIEAISDIHSLELLSDDLLGTITRIETDLEFRPGDEEWHGRARGALSAHQICRKHVDQRLRRLKRGDKPILVVTSDAKLEKQRLHAERVSNEKERSIAKRDRLQTQVEREKAAQQAAIQKRAIQVMHATSLGHAFMHAAIRVIAPEQYEAILSSATRTLEHNMKQMLGLEAEGLSPNSASGEAGSHISSIEREK